LPKRRYQAVITSLNGKIGKKDFDDKDFYSEIIGYYEMFIEPFKSRFEQEGKTERHLALYTPTGGSQRGKPWKKFKGKCNKCGKQGHKARDCYAGKNDEDGKSGKKFSGKCYNCNKFGHRSSECPKKIQSANMTDFAYATDYVLTEELSKVSMIADEYKDQLPMLDGMVTMKELSMHG